MLEKEILRLNQVLQLKKDEFAALEERHSGLLREQEEERRGRR
jgi:hypothetical protein